MCELIERTEFVRLTGCISSSNEYFRTVIKQQSVYCEHKGNLQEFKLLCALLSGLHVKTNLHNNLNLLS